MENNLTSSILIPHRNDLQSNIGIKPSNKMTGTITISPIDKNDLISTIDVKATSDLSSNIIISQRNKMTGTVEVTQPPTYTTQLNSIKDAFVREGIQTLNYGTEQTMIVGYSNELNERYRSFLEFDLLQLPDNIAIKKAEVKVYNVSARTNEHQVGLYSSASAWTEYGVTWNNQPAIQSFIDSKSIGTSEGYVSFDVTDKVSSWYEGIGIHNGFIFKALNESVQQYEQFYTRESLNNKPFLEVTYQEKVIYSAGRAEVNGNIFIKSVGKNDLPSSIRIPEYDINATLPSSIHIFNPDFMESSISVIRQNINGNIRVQRSDKSELSSNLVVKQKSLDQIEANVLVNTPSRVGHITIPYRNDLLSNLIIRQSDFSQIQSVIQINAPSRVGNIFVLYRNDLPSSILARAQGYDQLPSSIGVSRREITANLTVQRKEYSEINGSLTVKQSEVYTIDGSISVIRREIPSSILVVLSNYLNSSITIRRTEESSISASILVPFRKDLNSSIHVVGANMIPSNIFIRSGYLRANISIPVYMSSDTPSTIIIRVKWASDLPSSLFVGGDNIAGGHVFLI